MKNWIIQECTKTIRKYIKNKKYKKGNKDTEEQQQQQQRSIIKEQQFNV